jgi:hypothetical protein
VKDLGEPREASPFMRCNSRAWFSSLFSMGHKDPL